MTTRQLRVVIADETPMNRHLVRFFLEKDGIQVLAETARGDEAVSLAAELEPDAVVLDHQLGVMSGIDAIPLIREASPSTKIVLFSPSAGEPPIALPSRGADVYLEKDVGLKDLSFVLATLCASSFIAVEEEPAAAARKAEPTPRPAPRRRIAASLGAAAAAATLAVALVMFRTEPEAFRPPTAVTVPTVAPTAPPATSEGLAHLQAAMDDLDQLASMVTAGSARQVADLARALLEERAAAVAAGIDVSSLDALIAARLPGLMAGLSPETVLVLRAILGPLLPGPGGIFVLPEPPEQTGGETGGGGTGGTGGTFTGTGGGGGTGGETEGGGTGGGGDQGGGGGGGDGGGGTGGGGTGGGGGEEGGGGDTGAGGDEGDGGDGAAPTDQDEDEGDADEGDKGDPDNGNHGHDNGNHYGWENGVGNPHDEDPDDDTDDTDDTADDSDHGQDGDSDHGQDGDSEDGNGSGSDNGQGNQH